MRRLVVMLAGLIVGAVALGAVLGLAGRDGAAPVDAAGPSAGLGLRPPSLGGWAHRADPQDRGLAAGWARAVPGASAVALPGVPAAVVVGGTAGARSFAGSVAWWQGELRVPAAGTYAVRFGSVAHRATVWIDGRRACGHLGAYLSFDCRATLDRGGAHRIVLRADWRDPQRQAAEGFDRAWWGTGGPSWPVSARRVAPVELAIVGVRTQLVGDRRGTARVTLTVELRDTRTRGGAVVRRGVQGELRRGDRRIALRVAPVALAAGRRVRVRTIVDVRDATLWAPGSPALYDLTLGVTDATGRSAAGRRSAAGGRSGTGGTRAAPTGSAPGASVHRRVGLREIRRIGTQLLLNDRPLRLRGVGLPPDARGHGDALTARDRRSTVEQIRATGANVVRTQLPLSDELLEDLDRAGVLVWQLVGPFDKAGRFWAQTPRRRAHARARTLATVDREAAHPSVLAWSLSNELAGQGHPAGQAAYIDRTARELHRRTPGILVAADVWGAHLPRYAGPAYAHLDAVGVTEYIGLTELAAAPARVQEARAARRLDRLRAVLPDTAVVVTEFGANANQRNPAQRPGGLDYQADLLRRRITAYSARSDLAGMIVWTLRDYAVAPGFGGGSLAGVVPGLRLSGPLSEKGLFRFDGSAKPAVRAVREAFAMAAQTRRAAAG